MRAPDDNILRVGGGNAYVNNPHPGQAVQVAADTRCHSWGWSEGSNLIVPMRRLERYDPLISFGFEDERDANDCVMMVRTGLDVVHFSMTQVCEAVPGTEVGHARTFSMLAYHAPMLGPRAVVCHVAVHPNWIVGFDSIKNEVVAEYLRSINRLAHMIAFARSMGWIIVVTGDFNTRLGDRKDFETIYDLFEGFDLQVRVSDIDGAAWDPRLVLDNWHLIPSSETGSDHENWTVADLRRVR